MGNDLQTVFHNNSPYEVDITYYIEPVNLIQKGTHYVKLGPNESKTESYPSSIKHIELRITYSYPENVKVDNLGMGMGFKGFLIEPGTNVKISFDDAAKERLKFDYTEGKRHETFSSGSLR